MDFKTGHGFEKSRAGREMGSVTLLDSSGVTRSLTNVGLVLTVRRAQGRAREIPPCPACHSRHLAEKTILSFQKRKLRCEATGASCQQVSEWEVETGFQHLGSRLPADYSSVYVARQMLYLQDSETVPQ